MADEKITDFAVVTDVQATDAFVLARGGDNKQIAGSSLATELGGAGTELDYVEKTSNVTVTGSDGSPTTVVTANAVSFDGSTRVCIEMFVPVIQGDAGIAVFELWEGSNDLGYMGEAGPTSTGCVMMRRFLTPTSGSKTYQLMAWQSGGNKTLSMGSGLSSGTFNPGYIRITLA